MAKRDTVDLDGATITALRRGKGLGRDELADSVQSSYSHIYNVETGRRRPSIELAAKIANALGVPLERLVKTARDAA